MRYNHDIPRKDVTLEGIPFKWQTNLTDEQIRDFYSVIQDDPDITLPSSSLDVSGFFSLSFRYFDKFVEYLKGACHCIGFSNTIYVVYKTTYEWELWAARREELKELEEEQELERGIDYELFRTEENHLIEKCTEMINAKDFEQAYIFLCARADLLREHTQNGFSYFFYDEVFMRLSSFPVDYCIAFLGKYSLPWTAYPRLAASMAFWRGACDSELDQLLGVSVSLYPDEGFLFKDIVLFWRRRSNFSRAIHYCEVAVNNEVRDDTKSGFPGRLKRLKREAEQGGTGQPATRSLSKSEGSNKPQPESEGRSR